MVFCNVIAPLPLWIKSIRRNLGWLWVISIFVNIGMWFERYNIIVQSLSHEFLPYAFGYNRPSYIEMAITLGSFCWFLALFFLCAKLFPSVALTELKEVAPRPLRGRKGGHG
jgi:molybdopterin-containing oxidoreductase family membrane subunit